MQLSLGLLFLLKFIFGRLPKYTMSFLHRWAYYKVRSNPGLILMNFHFKITYGLHLTRICSTPFSFYKFLYLVPGVLQQRLECRPLQDQQHLNVGQQRDGLRQLRLQRHWVRRGRPCRLQQSSNLPAGGLQVQAESAVQVRRKLML